MDRVARFALIARCREDRVLVVIVLQYFLTNYRIELGLDHDGVREILELDWAEYQRVTFKGCVVGFEAVRVSSSQQVDVWVMAVKEKKMRHKKFKRRLASVRRP